MALDPQVVKLLEALKGAGMAPIEAQTPVEARRQLEAVVKARPQPAALRPVNVDELEIGAGFVSVKVRRYRVDAAPRVPAILYFHGGGHVIGSLDTHDALPRQLCAQLGACVLSVDYRLAPEARFPAAFEDAEASFLWLHQHALELSIDPRKVALVGDSAGGNLAAAVALSSRTMHLPVPRLQVLIYPVTDYSRESDSYGRFAEGFGPLTRGAMRWFKSHYLANDDSAGDWRASPLLAPLAGAPPALVITAGHDVLHDEGVAYAQALEAAGVSVRLIDCEGMIHGFFAWAASMDTPAQAQQAVVRALGDAFETNP